VTGQAARPAGCRTPPTGTVARVTMSPHPDAPRLTVAVTGPTGTFGFGLLPVLEAEPRIGSVIGVARRPFDPAEHGWTKLRYRQGDVREPGVLEDAFAGADVVVHLAFLIAGGASPEARREINVDGTVNAFRAAAAAGATRFVYASSVSAYGFHGDNPVGMTEEWPTRGATHLPYSQEKAELERLLAAEAEANPSLGLYVLRPPVVIGPHLVGGKSELAARVLPSLLGLARRARRLPVHAPLFLPDLPIQVIHEEDVGTAFLQCILGEGPPGAYNIAADGILRGRDLARELGFHPVTVGTGLLLRTFRGIASLPLPGAATTVSSWAEAVGHPVIVDTTKAKEQLGWKPRFSAEEAVRATIDPPA
jgi:nucleoside-diphosphate-sugar epimerase